MSSLSLYNSLTRKKEPFIPFDLHHIKMYVCGPTVYDFAHIGNARPFVVFDVLYRLLRYSFPQVTYVRNITDVDDKINHAASVTKVPIQALTERTTAIFHEDMAALNILPPTIEPRATHHITEMIDMIKTLIEKKHAYAAQGHVLFSVKSYPSYGQLSQRHVEDMIAGARVEIAPYKHDPMDFVLWKPSTSDQPGWESPWGRGRPGWHIECSAMSKKYLGITFDIHGGGQDLLFPHHENECAQSSAAHEGAPLARYWLHNGYLTVSNEKMSKSLGNFITVHELLPRYHGEIIRYTLLTNHYRQPFNWTEALVEQSKQSLDRLYTALQSVSTNEEDNDDSSFISSCVRTALEDDLNTPAALAHLHQLATTLNKATHAKEQQFLKRQLLTTARTLLGILHCTPEQWFQGFSNTLSSLSEKEINTLIAERFAARQSKNFSESDRIREYLKDHGI